MGVVRFHFRSVNDLLTLSWPSIPMQGTAVTRKATKSKGEAFGWLSVVVRREMCLVAFVQ